MGFFTILLRWRQAYSGPGMGPARWQRTIAERQQIEQVRRSTVAVAVNPQCGAGQPAHAVAPRHSLGDTPHIVVVEVEKLALAPQRHDLIGMPDKDAEATVQPLRGLHQRPMRTVAPVLDPAWRGRAYVEPMLKGDVGKDHRGLLETGALRTPPIAADGCPRPALSLEHPFGTGCWTAGQVPMAVTLERDR